MSDMPLWLTLTVAAALLEAKSIAFHKRSEEVPHATYEDIVRANAIYAESSRFSAWNKRVRRRAAVEAFRAGVVGENWRRVYNPIAFSDPMFKKTHETYTAVDLPALRQDWRAELARISEHGPQQFDNDPRKPGWRHLKPDLNFEAIRMDDGSIVRFGEAA